MRVNEENGLQHPAGRELTFVFLNSATIRLVDRDDFADILHYKCSRFDGRIGSQTKSTIASPEDLEVMLDLSHRKGQVAAFFAGLAESWRTEELHDPELRIRLSEHPDGQTQPARTGSNNSHRSLLRDNRRWLGDRLRPFASRLGDLTEKDSIDQHGESPWSSYKLTL